MSQPIVSIRAAFDRIHAKAVDHSAPPYMSVPARPGIDADLILSDAIEELADLRAHVTALTAERDAARAALQIVIGHSNCYCETCKELSHAYWIPPPATAPEIDGTVET